MCKVFNLSRIRTAGKQNCAYALFFVSNFGTIITFEENLVMKNSIQTALTLFVIAISFSACVNGKGDVVVQNFDVSGFTKIDHGVKGDVVLVNDVNQFVEVHAQQNIINILKIDVEDNTLKIRTKSAKSIGNYEELTFYVHAPLIDYVKIGGKGTVKGDNITGTNFSCRLTADGSLELAHINADYVEVIITGAGQVTLKGNSNKTDIGIGSSGHAKCFELLSKECNTQLKGNGIIETYAINKLDVQLSGNGTIYYKGNPTVTSHITGNGILVHSN